MVIMMKQKFVMDINPSKGEMFQKIKCSSPGEISSGVKLARKALKTWGFLQLRYRFQYINKIVKELRLAKEELAKLITIEMGKPIKMSYEEIDEAINVVLEIMNYAEEAFKPKIHKDKSSVSEVIRAPIGIVAVYSSFNYPVLTSVRLIVSAIIAGNTVVYKPSDITPLLGKTLFEIINRVLPKGVINLVQGGEEVSDYLLSTDINMVSYIGDRENGRKINVAIASKFFRVLMELQGKDAMIVLKDANIEKAAKFAVEYSLKNCGQDNNSIERIYVDAGVFDKFTENVISLVKKIKVGDPFENVDLGPLATESLRTRVFGQIEEARRKGAKIVFGGTKPDTKGYFLNPTVVVDVSEKHDLLTEETFGPVISIQKMFSLEDIIEKINRSPFGLGVSIWSQSSKRSYDIATKIECGMVSINRPVTGVKGTPYIGFRESGLGYSGNVEALRLYTQPKKITYENIKYG